MSQETKLETAGAFSVESWQAGVIGGLGGSIAFGLVMLFVIPDPVLEVAIPNLYGIEATPENPAPGIGWSIHLAHGAVLGVVFAALLAVESVGNNAGTPSSTGVLGLSYGVIIWAVFAVVVMPIWLSAVGFGGAPPLPNISELSLLGHAVYGAVLGVSYSLLVR